MPPTMTVRKKKKIYNISQIAYEKLLSLSGVGGERKKSQLFRIVHLERLIRRSMGQKSIKHGTLRPLPRSILRNCLLTQPTALFKQTEMRKHAKEEENERENRLMKRLRSV